MRMSLRIRKRNSIVFFTQTRRSFLPGSDERFNLQRYKEEIGKPYSKIVLYLCRWAEYYSAHVNDLGYSSGNENSDDILVLFTF